MIPHMMHSPWGGPPADHVILPQQQKGCRIPLWVLRTYRYP